MSQTSNEKKRQLIVYSLIIIAVGFGLLMLFLLFSGLTTIFGITPCSSEKRNSFGPGRR